MGAVAPPSAATKLLVFAIFVVLICYADRVAMLLQGWDGVIFWVVIAFFIAASRIGTNIVKRIAAEGGELPANDEMFNLPEISTDPVAASQQHQSPVSERTESWWPSYLRFRAKSAAVA